VTDLFNRPVLLIHQPTPRLDYQITDAQGGGLARTVRVVGRRKSAIKRFFSAGDTSHVVIQVARPDGAPLFFVDRPARRRAASMAEQPPCFVVAPDGTPIGRMEQNARAFAQSLLHAQRMGEEGFTQAYRLFAAQGGPLCEVTQEPVRVLHREPYAARSVGGGFITYTDMNQVQIARLEPRESGSFAKSFSLHLRYRLPDPLCVLVIASPIAMLLMDAAVSGW
jgi:hypothetical protein